MSDELPVSVFGKTIDPRDGVSEIYRVPPEERKDTDEDGSADTDALTDDPRDRGEEE